MNKKFEVKWEGELPAAPEAVWDALTKHSDGYLWKIEYEPRVGGAERGLTDGGGTVTVWDPPHHFVTLADNGENQLDYVFEPTATGTYVRYVHNGAIPEEHFVNGYESCIQHTDFYHHSLGQYARYFSGRKAVYVSAKANTNVSKVRQALGLPDDLAVGDKVTLTPEGMDPIDGIIDYTTDAFTGVRSADALYRVYGRDVWASPVGVAHHFFADNINENALQEAWSAWLEKAVA
jgi:uncharacterized protein YndB with AHSA1/START domain